MTKYAQVIETIDFDDADMIHHHIDPSEHREYEILNYLPNDHIYVLDIVDQDSHTTMCIFYDRVIPDF